MADMEEDDLIRRALRDYAYAAPPGQLRQTTRAHGQRRQTLARLATAAIVLLVIGGVIAWIALARPSTVPPVDPTPSPSVSSSASPSPSPSPSLVSGYREQSREANGLPTGVLGETVEGLTLIDIEITDAECPDAARCPGTGSLTVENSTSATISALVYFNVFRNNTPAVGDAQVVQLAPGESTTVTIDVQPALADNAPVGRTGSIYSWNFSVELT
jgi:hypothetical protein